MTFEIDNTYDFGHCVLVHRFRRRLNLPKTSGN